jgi:NADPH-dependent 2,4-dienoyl-CoA reductase/sulfur reductase-like enzyme
LVESGLPITNKRVVVAGSGPLLLAVAAHLKERGARILAVAEQAPLSKVAGFATRLSMGKIAQGAQLAWQLRGVRVFHSAWPVSAQGDDRLRMVRVHTQSGVRSFECDYLACGFGLVPNTELAQVCGCEIRDGYVVVDELQQTSIEGVLCVGEPTGIGGVDRSLVEGQIGGYVAADALGHAQGLLKAQHRHRRFGKDLANAFSLRNELKKMCSPGTVVCRCEDVAWQDILKHDDWRSAKLQTRCGMGPCQGRICGAAIGFLTDQRLRFDSVRAPVFAASLETLASAPEIEADAAS